MISRILIVFSMLIFLSSGIAHADELTAEKRADIERLLEMTGSMAIGKQMSSAFVSQMMQAIKKAKPNIPQRALEIIPQEIDAVFEANIPAFKNAIIPVYHSYFTATEIKEMIRFYSTDLGKKTIRVMPMLVQESMIVGQKWGQQLGPKINERIRARLQSEGIQI